ncbi:MAG: Lon protease family protein [Halodesulfovibrio sp.]|uniref:Lon protease family protein n=1 Tax=Halodesulfovibrio sp. TaxID=1912772 RepID=UPI00359CD5FE
MSKIRPLSAKKLRAKLALSHIPYKSSTDIKLDATSFHAHQPRAMQALELALHIKDIGYNIFLAGSANLGRNYMLQEFLRERAKALPVPPDMLYVNNFDDPDAPILLTVPAGKGRSLKQDFSQAISNVRKELPKRFESDSYLKKRTIIMDQFAEERDSLFKEMDSIAGKEGFHMDLDEQGSITLYPLIDGKRLSEDEFERIDSVLKKSLKSKGDKLLQALNALLRNMSNAEQGLRTKEKNLDNELTTEVLDELLQPVIKQYEECCHSEPLAEFFKASKADILEHVEALLPKEPSNAPLSLPEALQQQHPEDATAPYDINVFVDHSETKGAPIIMDDHPTVANLLGCIQREAEMGALITDFSLIKSGSLHQANGGFLLLHIEDILSQNGSWEGLMRALRSGLVRIEDSEEGQEATKTKGIEPEPLLLDLKVILIGGEEIYEQLLESDDRFPKLFKIKAHLNDAMPRGKEGYGVYLHRMAGIIDDCDLLPFTKEAMAEVIDYGSRIVEDQTRLSLKFPLVREIMIEASALASMDKKKVVDGSIVHKTLITRHYRNNLYEEIFFEEYDRDLIKVTMQGEKIGRVNGLSVSMYGDFEFGLPHQIASTVGVGHGGVIDLERDAELSGPIHTKAMMILKSYLIGMFAHNKPLVLTGSLYFEQGYAGVEGDSASGAELAALLSALAEVPLSQSYAFTGAVSQSGEILAVGGVTRKIEGYFDICSRRGLTGKQGVILPKDNVDQLMLKREIADKVEEGLFSIYPVTHIEQALELLTGMKCGSRRKDGSFTKDSLFGRVDSRLKELGRLATHAYKQNRK